ncbi:MAG: outer membrane protein assembly factor BamA, partial [Bradymonadia bacterium]
MTAPRAAARWLLPLVLCPALSLSAPSLSTSLLSALCLGTTLSLLPAPAFAQPQRTLLIESITVSGVRIGRRLAMVTRTGLERGALLDEAEIDEARARLIETGLFTRVTPRLARGSAPGRVGVHFECVERNTTSVDAVHLGHARPTPLWAGVDVSDIDPFGRGFSLGGGVVSSGDQTAARISLGRPRAFGQGVGLTIRARIASGREPFVGPKGQQIAGDKVDQIFVPYRRAGLGGTLRIDLDPRTQLATGLRLELVEAEVPRGAEQIDADRSVQPFDFGIGDGRGVMPIAGLGLSHDTRDDPSAPRRGRRTGFSLRGGYFD